MARKSKEKVLLDVLEEARMITLPLGTQMLWLKMARLLLRDGISVFRFGSTVLGLNGLARLLSLPETETETELKTKITELCERGLLALEADGAISCPMLAQAITRSEINRINGSKGGRPRKDGQPPGQRTMLLPINGGAQVETEKTKPETQPGESAAHTTINDKKVVSDSEYHDVGQAVLDAVGIDPAKSFLHYGPVRGWLADGATKDLILDTVRGIMARPDMTAERVKSLKFFTSAIVEAVAKMPPKKALWEKKWEDDYRIWELTRRGEAPRAADYRQKYAA